MADETEPIRRALTTLVNATLSPEEGKRYAELVEQYGPDDVYDSDGIRANFEVKGFAAPYVVVRRRSDGVTGSLMFCHSPRFYFGFVPDNGR